MTRTMPVLVSLLFAAYAVNGVRQSVNAAQKHAMDSEGVPSEISNAIRKAKSLAKKALQDAEAREAEVNDRKVIAEQTAEQKEQAEKEKGVAARDATARTKEASDQAKTAATAASDALSSKGDWNDAVKGRQEADQSLQDAIDAYNDMSEHVQAEIRKLNKMLSDKEQAMTDARTAAQRAGLKADELRIAYEAAKGNDDAQVKALTAALEKVSQANTVASEKAASARNAGREAEAAQFALEDAVAEWNAAKEVVQHKRDMREHLWALYDRIEEFYDASSALTKVMRRSEDECSDPPHQCLVSDGPGGGGGKLKEVLEGYNTMVLAFMTIKELYLDVYAEIAEAGIEIETNAMAQVKLSCDPDYTLENAGNPEDFNAKCGDGLWPALDLTKNRFF